MKHAFALAALLAGLSGPAALAQTAEARLAGAPQRVCSDDDIRQAMDGSYTGEPCRFREMPQGQADSHGAAMPARPSPSQVRPARAQTAASTGHAPAQVMLASDARHGSSFIASSHYESSSQREVRPAVAPLRHADAARQGSVSLGPEFFTGSLVGGVEARLPVIYSYRRTILIDAAGGVQLAGPGTSLVHVMDRPARPPQHTSPGVRRAYPGY